MNKDEERKYAYKKNRKTFKFLFKEKVIRSESTVCPPGYKFTINDLKNKIAQKA